MCSHAPSQTDLEVGCVGEEVGVAREATLLRVGHAGRCLLSSSLRPGAIGSSMGVLVNLGELRVVDLAVAAGVLNAL